MTTTVAVADGIFSIEDGQPKLLGSRCTNCGNHMFPRQSGCPKCMFDEQEDVELATTGTLWTWTVQAFPPKAPPYLGPTGDDFVPYGVGYVELPGQLRVEATAHRVRPREADHRHGDGARDRPALHRRRRQPGRHLRIRPQQPSASEGASS